MKTIKEVKIQELNISKSNVVNLNKMRLFTGIDEVELTDELIDKIVKEKNGKIHYWLFDQNGTLLYPDKNILKEYLKYLN